MRITHASLLSCTFVISTLLNGCSVNQMPASAYSIASDKAALFLYRPSAFASGGVSSSFRLNDQHIGSMTKGYHMVGLKPGGHQIKAFFPADLENDYYQGTLNPNAKIAQLKFKASPGEKIYVRFTTDNQLVQVPIATGDSETEGLTFSTTKIAFMHKAFETQEDRDFEQCEQSKDLATCERFLAQYPNSYHSDKLLPILKTLKTKQQLDKKFERDKVLPLEVRKDKYMVALTTHLKNERYQEAMQYFDWLEKLNTTLSDSFNFFYGEALLKTGQPTKAIEKLYTYVTTVGNTGKHYNKALELVNQAEVMEQSGAQPSKQNLQQPQTTNGSYHTGTYEPPEGKTAPQQDGSILIQAVPSGN